MGCVAREERERYACGLQRKLYHQTMRLSVVYIACSEGMFRGIGELDDWMLKWDWGGNSTLRTLSSAADTLFAHIRIPSLQQEHAH
jgi:hypothetical protein